MISLPPLATRHGLRRCAILGPEAQNRRPFFDGELGLGQLDVDARDLANPGALRHIPSTKSEEMAD